MRPERSILILYGSNFKAKLNYICGLPYRLLSGKGLIFDILTNQKRESTVFSLLIGRNMRPFTEDTVLYFSDSAAYFFRCDSLSIFMLNRNNVTAVHLEAD